MELFHRTPLDTDGGIKVNKFLETIIPGVWAAGDVTNYLDQVFHRRTRVEHWDIAVEQGRVAMRNMTGKLQPFIQVPYFFSDAFDLSYESWGMRMATTRWFIGAIWIKSRSASGG
jgi:NADPH-dependent 2,4-dienoyl-CoA reductase/sulfur reductase-like enzyme